MRKLSKIAFGIIISIFIIFTSCKKYTDTSDLNLSVSQDRFIGHLGDTIPIMINASTSDDAIKSVTVTKTGGISIIIPEVLNNQKYSHLLKYIVNDSVGTLEITVTLKGYVASVLEKTLKYNIVKDIPITLGTTSSTYPSFINGNTLATFDSINAFANENLVDLEYTYNNFDGATLSAPNDINLNLFNWTIKNPTKIGRIMKESPYEIAIVNGTSVKNLMMGDMIGYVTSTGVKGIIEVMNVANGYNGNIQLTFMVLK